jgi:hypothetical protein
MKNARWLALSAAAVCIGLLLSLFFARGDASDAGPMPPPSVRPPPADRAGTHVPAAAAPLSLIAPAPSAAMRARFESAANYAAFIHDAMQRPGEGGRFYALMAFEKCREVLQAELPAADGADAAPRAAAIAGLRALRQRCEGVPQQFPDEAIVAAALRHENARGTPDALFAERGLLLPTSRENSAGDMARAYASNDPYLIAVTLDSNLDFFADKLGDEYRNGGEQGTLYLAMAAARCEITGDCGNNYRAWIQCVSTPDCSSTDYRIMIRASLPPESRDLYDRTVNRLLEFSSRRAIP